MISIAEVLGIVEPINVVTRSYTYYVTYVRSLGHQPADYATWALWWSL